MKTKELNQSRWIHPDEMMCDNHLEFSILHFVTATVFIGLLVGVFGPLLV